jgi:hypothetical protein
MREVKTMWATIAAPASRGDTGSVVETFWYVENGVLSLCSEDGVATGPSERLEPGGNERAVASRLRKREFTSASESGDSDWNRRIDYGPLGIA